MGWVRVCWWVSGFGCLIGWFGLLMVLGIEDDSLLGTFWC